MSIAKKITSAVAGCCCLAQSVAQQPGDKIFEIDLGGGVYPPALIPDGRIVATTKSLFGGANQLVVLKPDGSVQWQTPLPTFGAAPPVVDAGGRIYVGAGDKNLYAYTFDGVKLWMFPTETQIFSAPAIAADGTLYVSAVNVNKVYALNPDGTKKWEFSLAGSLGGPVAGADGTIYVTIGAGFFGQSQLWALTAAGEKKWSLGLGGEITAPALNEDGAIYIGAGAYVHAINPDGAIRWKTSVGGFLGPPTISLDGTIYISTQGRLVAVNPDGSPKWQMTTEETSAGSTSVGSDGKIYYNTSARFYCLGPDGRVQWSVALRGFISSSALAENRVYVGGDGRFLAFHTSSSGPAQSPWPMYQHDAQRTGRASGSTVFRFAKHPQDLTVPEFAEAKFSVEMMGENLRFQWRHDGVDLPGETQPALKINPVRAKNAGTYDVVVTHPNGIGASAPAKLTVIAIQPFVQRRLPERFYPQTEFKVVLSAAPPAAGSVYAVEDRPPQGWRIQEGTINENGFFDQQTGKVKFGPFFDSTARELSYDLKPPIEGDASVNSFDGQSSVEGVTVPLIGDSQINLEALLHPADISPADNEMSIGEATAYGGAWRRGQTWPIDPNPIPIEYVTRAGTLWKGGERYFFSNDGKELPLRWVNRVGPRPQSLSRSDASPVQQKELPRAMAAMPALYIPGQAFRVTISVEPARSTLAFALEEQIPAGWEITDVSHGGEAHPVNGHIRWGPFFDGNSRELTFAIRSPVNASDNSTFKGTASFDGVNFPISGLRTISPGFALAIAPAAGQGTLRLRLTGGRNAAYRIDVSQDLKNWVEWLRVPAAQTTAELELPAPRESGQRFFRAVRLEAP